MVELNIISYNVNEKLPNQKELVLVDTGRIVIPAIYYKSLGGFYHISTYYHSGKTVYDDVKIEFEHEIKGVEYWCKIPEYLKKGTDTFLLNKNQ